MKFYPVSLASRVILILPYPNLTRLKFILLIKFLDKSNSTNEFHSVLFIDFRSSIKLCLRFKTISNGQLRKAKAQMFAILFAYRSNTINEGNRGLEIYFRISQLQPFFRFKLVQLAYSIHSNIIDHLSNLYFVLLRSHTPCFITFYTSFFITSFLNFSGNPLLKTVCPVFF